MVPVPVAPLRTAAAMILRVTAKAVAMDLDKVVPLFCYRLVGLRCESSGLRVGGSVPWWFLSENPLTRF